ncbi:hypothetical protein [Hymenobacter sp. BRD67]|uniref:hypothetical protein n=1 Tax=Hymenobacter sp. BRD67 TaxID=2675877 RepID=UPI0015675FF2|nr:hypothetical protein [Hymenobacter sp. BRD67]QKG52468.1 hypothetical protein GKZ67_07435 [Hymenobacter sp. BRD67]
MSSFFRLLAAYRPWALSILALPALLAGCRHEVVVVPAYDNYFPVDVGTYRTYAVADSNWVKGALTVSNYQFRERVTEQFADAAGQPAYRLVRSKRPNSAAGWVDDSASVVQPMARAVVVTRNNIRTVALIYPAQPNKGWNDMAFSASPDTITSLTRFYGPNVAAPYTVPAAQGQPAVTYPTTVTTKTTLDGVSTM